MSAPRYTCAGCHTRNERNTCVGCGRRLTAADLPVAAARSPRFLLQVEAHLAARAGVVRVEGDPRGTAW